MAGREIINTLTIIVIIIMLSCIGLAILRYYTKHFMQNNSLKPHKNPVG